MKKSFVAVLATAALTSPLLGAITSTADASGYYYSSCSRLHVKYRHGVAKSYAAGTYQVRKGYGRPASGPTARKVYWENYKRLDRDRDGTACEA